MAIPKGHRANFNTLQKAFAQGDVALMECVDRKTKKPVFVLCAVEHHTDPKEEFVMKPFAKLFDGNPYEEVDPPEAKT